MKKNVENIVHHAEVSEKEIEKYLCKRMKEIGLPCLKYSNPNMVGYPDRLIVLPCNIVMWVELKSKGKKPTKVQQLRIAELKQLKHVVWVIDNKPLIDELVTELQKYKADNKEAFDFEQKKSIY
ncbi:VRR-NUC domain-containing protein [Prevotella sp. OH937_COT-195]|uniref:VRR-NUC domain-containing protein n=1 Tax=Prevotella sp. OH937_COT-195 TaxID=2491051 RepID=UPI0018F53DA2|nr:VRR-NUC domain-containing protein [Prevotella sp. OH937_COT-195]